MENKSSNTVLHILIAAGALLLAVVAVISAFKLYESRNESISPTNPENTALAQTLISEPVACEPLAFTLSSAIISGTPSQSPTPSVTKLGGVSLTPTQTISLTPTITKAPTATPSATTALSPSGTVVPSASPTTASTLPDAGVSTPTTIALIIGGMMTTVAIFLAL